MKKKSVFFYLVIIFMIASSITMFNFYKKMMRFKHAHGKLYSTVYTLKDTLDNTVNELKLIKFFGYKSSLPLEKLPQLDFLSPKQLLRGKAEMKKHNVVFVGISRDNEPQLLSVINHIEYIGKHFKDYRVIIFENDSKDHTKMIFDLWQESNPKVKIKSEDFNNKKRPSILFLADIRNKYLEILTNEEYKDFDMVIALDMDMGYGFDIRGIEHSFSMIDRWDSVCSNGIQTKEGNMYDAFAFRNDEFPYSPPQYDEKFGKDAYWSGDFQMIQKIYDPKMDLVPVHSCFGGMAIYKKYLFEACKYDSEQDDCEHVALHECMRSKHKARMFMNPAQMLRYDHYK